LHLQDFSMMSQVHSLGICLSTVGQY